MSLPAAATAAVVASGAVAAVLHCSYIVPRKKRTCRMLVKPGKRFCGEHKDKEKQGQGQEDEGTKDSGRIPCPYDDKHTVSRTKLETHLKKCAARPKDLPEYCVKGINAGCEAAAADKLTLAGVSDERLLSLIKKVNAVHERLLKTDPVLEAVLSHPVLEEEAKEPYLGLPALKHLKQNSSLIAHLEKEGMLKVCWADLSLNAYSTEWFGGCVKNCFWIQPITQYPGTSVSLKVFQS